MNSISPDLLDTSYKPTNHTRVKSESVPARQYWELIVVNNAMSNQGLFPQGVKAQVTKAVSDRGTYINVISLTPLVGSREAAITTIQEICKRLNALDKENFVKDLVKQSGGLTFAMTLEHPASEQRYYLVSSTPQNRGSDVRPS